jgi:hypothetical protein
MKGAGIICGIGLVACWMSGTRECRADVNLTDKLRKDAVPQWESLRAEVMKLSGEVKENVRVPARGVQPARENSRRIQYWLRGALSKYEINSVPDVGTLVVYGRNSRDRFEIDRDGKVEPLHVLVYSPIKQSRSRMDDGAKFYLAIPLAGFYIEGVDLCEGIKQGRVTVKRIGEKDSSGHVAATLSIAGEGNNGADYEVVFLADRGWVISEWSAMHFGATSRGNVHYFDSVLGGRYPSSNVMEDIDKNGAPIATAEYLFGEPKACDAPEEAFTLASYGLTPAGVIAPAEHMAPWRWKLLIGNVVAVGLLVSILWWRSFRAEVNG